VSAIGWYLEAQGIATVSISLIREHSVALKAPRALWVPFMLGRPLGAPSQPDFQLRVLLSALELLPQTQWPALVDFPEDAPEDQLGFYSETLVCPVSFPSKATEGDIAEKLLSEIAQLQAWYNLAIQVKGRTTTGITGCSPEELGKFILSWLTDQEQKELKNLDYPPAALLKLATDELKAFYYEAKSMQAGKHTFASIQDWFWFETTAGEVYLAIKEKVSSFSDPSFKGLATVSLVPRSVQSKVVKTKK
jgi:hypothetical protein